jgi:hypothetical protein
MSQIDSIYVENYISVHTEIIYFKLLTLLLTYRFGYNEELNYPLSEDELNIETLRMKSVDIDNKISLEQCIIIASSLLDNIDDEYDEFIEDIEDTNVGEKEISDSFELYNKLYYDMLDTTYKNNILVKNIFINMLNEGLQEAIREEDYESASIINNKIFQINS